MNEFCIFLIILKTSLACILYFIEQPVYIVVTPSTTTASTTTPTTSTSTTSTSTTPTTTSTSTTTTTTTTTVPPCPDGWEFQSFPNTYPACYKVFTGPVNFIDAETQCQMTNYLGNIAHVTSVHSVAENNYIISLTSAGGTAAFTDFTWLGLFDIGGGFLYTDGSPFDFNIWGFGQPGNTAIEPCVQLINNPGSVFTVGQWNTIPCTLTQRNYVCKLRAV